MTKPGMTDITPKAANPAQHDDAEEPQLPSCISQELFDSLIPLQKENLLEQLEIYKERHMIVVSAEKQEGDLVLINKTNFVLPDDLVPDSLWSIKSLAGQLKAESLPPVVRSIVESINCLASLALFELDGFADMSTADSGAYEVAAAVSAALKRVPVSRAGKQVRIFQLLKAAAKSISKSAAERDEITTRMVETIPLMAGVNKTVPLADLTAIWDAPDKNSQLDAINELLRGFKLGSTNGEALKRVCDRNTPKPSKLHSSG